MRRRDLKYGIGGGIGASLLNGLLRTARLEEVNAAPWQDHVRQGGSVVFALWHGQLLAPTYAHRHENMVTLASQSGDGEYIARMLDHWGYHAVRGSSSRGGDSALRELVRLVRAGRSVALTADGPRGPRHRLKYGVLQIAQLTGAPVIAVGTAVERAWTLNTWDRFTVPKPFTRIRNVYSDPQVIDRKARETALADEAARIEMLIAELTAEAAAVFQ
jgi:lysophospholipid acyltransferase (LPLAT)-like uncharacterized protein